MMQCVFLCHSAKKSIIATDNIEFLGMIIKDGHYQPGKHIAQELLHFPDQQLSKKQVQHVIFSHLYKERGEVTILTLSHYCTLTMKTYSKSAYKVIYTRFTKKINSIN